MSSLDSLSERHVMGAVDNLMEGRTVIVIAHRFSTLRDADRIFVVDHGTIVDSGTHAELDAHDGLYRAMYREQIRDVPSRPVIDLVVHEKPMDGVIDITTRRIVGPSGE